MADTYTLISSVTVGAGGASSIDFTSIPSTYTDLQIVLSGRSTTTTDYCEVRFNGSSAGLSGKYVYSNGSSAASASYQPFIYINSSANTADIFNNSSVYVPNYAGSAYKSVSIDSVYENNSTTAYIEFQAGLWSNTSAINQVTLVCTGASQNFAQYSTAYLYGISNS